MSSGHKQNDDASRRRSTLVSQNSTAGVSYITGGKAPSRKRQYDDEEDTSTLSSSRVELLEEEIERVTMANTQLAEENEKLRTLWEKERKEREQFHKKIMQKALQTVTMEKRNLRKGKKVCAGKIVLCCKVYYKRE
jgi:molecular chaperone GrpE (heat shock protein)